MNMCLCGMITSMAKTQRFLKFLIGATGPLHSIFFSKTILIFETKSEGCILDFGSLCKQLCCSQHIESGCKFFASSSSSSSSSCGLKNRFWKISLCQQANDDVVVGSTVFQQVRLGFFGTTTSMSMQSLIQKRLDIWYSFNVPRCCRRNNGRNTDFSSIVVVLCFGVLEQLMWLYHGGLDFFCC